MITAQKVDVQTVAQPKTQATAFECGKIQQLKMHRTELYRLPAALLYARKAIHRKIRQQLGQQQQQKISCLSALFSVGPSHRGP